MCPCSHLLLPLLPPPAVDPLLCVGSCRLLTLLHAQCSRQPACLPIWRSMSRWVPCVEFLASSAATDRRHGVWRTAVTSRQRSMTWHDSYSHPCPPQVNEVMITAVLHNMQRCCWLCLRCTTAVCGVVAHVALSCVKSTRLSFNQSLMLHSHTRGGFMCSNLGCQQMLSADGVVSSTLGSTLRRLWMRCGCQLSSTRTRLQQQVWALQHRPHALCCAVLVFRQLESRAAVQLSASEACHANSVVWPVRLACAPPPLESSSCCWPCLKRILQALTVVRRHHKHLFSRAVMSAVASADI
jgi:hypothetical protein